MQEIQGMYVAAITPFDAHGVFRSDWQADHFAWLQEHGIDGVLVAGTNGEGPSLSADERRALIDAAMRNRGTMQLMAGTGTSSLSETIALSRYALDAGVDAVLIVPPFYFRNAPEEGLVRYYRALCDALPSSGRVLMYHIPAVSGVPITHGLIRQLRQSHPQQTYGIKDTGGDAVETAKAVAAFPQLCVMGGSDHLVAANLRAGVRGQISGLANAFPELFAGIMRAWRAGDDIDTWQQRINTVRDVLFAYPSHAAIKAVVADRLGPEQIWVKPPLVDLQPEQRSTLRHAIDHVVPA